MPSVHTFSKTRATDSRRHAALAFHLALLMLLACAFLTTPAFAEEQAVAPAPAEATAPSPESAAVDETSAPADSVSTAELPPATDTASTTPAPTENAGIAAPAAEASPALPPTVEDASQPVSESPQDEAAQTVTAEPVATLPETDEAPAPAETSPAADDAQAADAALDKEPPAVKDEGGKTLETAAAPSVDAPIPAAAPIAAPKEAPKAKISSVKAENAIYTGRAITPAITVKSGSRVLVQGTDYRLALSKNKKVGKALVTVTGIGKYAGTLNTTFRIFGKPKYSGATLMPVLAKSVWMVKNAKIKLISGKTVVKLKGKTVTALKKGTAKIGIYNKLGKKVATKKVQVFSFAGGILLRPASSKKLYLDIADSSLEASAAAQVTARNTKVDQHFLVSLAKGNGYTIQALNSGLVLQAKKASKKNSAPIVQAAPNGKAAQRWAITVDGNNRLTFVNKASGKALTLKSPAKSGVAAVQRTNKNAKTQKWAMVVQKVSYAGANQLPVSATAAWKVKNGIVKVTAGKDVVSFKDGVLTAKQKGSATVTITDAIGTKIATQAISVYALSGNYYIDSALDAGMVLDIDHSSTKDGGNAILWWSNGQDNQKWSFKRQDDGSYLIKSAGSGKVLQVAQASAKNRANIEQWKATGDDNQKWNITVDASNALTFVNKASGKALALEGGSTVKGTNISQSTVRASQQAQKFNLVSLKKLQQTNSKLNALAVAACKYAYSVPVRYKYKKENTGTTLYQRLCKTLFRGLEPLSCDRGVACAVRWSGADVSFPSGTHGQYTHMMKSSNWQYLGRWSGSESDLQPGDVLIRTTNMQNKDKKTTTNHICMYVGTDIVKSMYKSYIKGTEGDRGAPASNASFVSAFRQRANRANAAAACIGSKSYASADQRMVVFRCTNTSFSTKYSYIL